MTVILRFADLKKRGIVNNWPQLKRSQTLHGFPVGKMLSPNVRGWPEHEVDKWLSERPTERTQPPNGAARRAKRARATPEISDEARRSVVEGYAEAWRSVVEGYERRLIANADTRHLIFFGPVRPRRDRRGSA
jgi:hypothetical protein